VVGAVVLPRDERALLPVRTDRVRAEQLVKRQWGGGPRLVLAGAEESARGLLRIGPEQQGHLPRLAEVLLVRPAPLLGEAEWERRVRVVPTDQVGMLCLELLLDAIPQPGDGGARAVAGERQA